MRLKLRCIRILLTAMLLATSATRSRAFEPEELSDAVPSRQKLAPEAPQLGADASASQGWDDDFSQWEGGCDSDCCPTGGCWLRRLPCLMCSPCLRGNGNFYFGADYLLVKPRFSQAVGRSDRTAVTDTTVTPNTSTFTDTAVEYQFDYQSNYRVFAGYHDCCCGGDIQFTYWRLQGDGETGLGPATNITTGPSSGSQLNIDTTENGDRIGANSSVSANIFDIDFNKCLPLGGSPQPCDPCACPRWDLRWFAGVRIVDLDRRDQNVLLNVNDAVKAFGDVSATFRGAGPRVGMQGRRYFGDCSRFSLFAKGSGALLLGEYSCHRERTILPTTAGGVTNIAVQDDDLNRIVPMAEIELGASYQACERLFVTVGWFFQAWVDVASSQGVEDTNFGRLDTANIIGFDGLTVRAEYVY